MKRCGPTLEKASSGEQDNHSFVPKRYQFCNLSKDCMDTQGWLLESLAYFVKAANYRKGDSNLALLLAGKYSCCSSKPHTQVTLFRAVPACVTVCTMLYSSRSH